MLIGLSIFYLVRGDLQTARALGEQLFSLASHLQEPARLVGAHLAMGAPLLWLGVLDAARAHLEQGMACYDPQQHRAYTALYRNDPGVACLFYAAVALWVLGYPDQALHRSLEAVALAREQSHPFSLAFAVVGAAGLHQFRREAGAVQEQAAAVITLSAEHGFIQWLTAGTILDGWALAEQGRQAEGIVQMRQGLEAWRTTGAELTMPYYLSLLAGAYGAVGQSEEGLHVLAEALSLGEKTGECWCEAELYRLKGELLLSLSRDHHPEAATCFHHALDVARRQHATSWELRAATSLARLWQSQGKRQEARALLAAIYGWFTEGFDTADLQEAKRLLEELG